MVTKGVIPAAGMGTRMLPASKTVPKEMICIADKPAILYIVEELVQSGISDILIITSRGKSVMEDFFDKSPELERALSLSKKEELYEEMRRISSLADITYVRQQEPKGLGHAVYCAKNFAGNDPFALLLPDDIIYNPDNPATAQLCMAYKQTGCSVLGVQQVEISEISKYGSIAPNKVKGRLISVLDMIEKPKPEEALSNYAALGRYCLSSDVFSKLENTKPGKCGEIQLTDALKSLAHENKLYAYDFEGRRYDTGSKLGYLEAVVEYGIRGEYGSEFTSYLKELVKNI